MLFSITMKIVIQITILKIILFFSLIFINKTRITNKPLISNLDFSGNYFLSKNFHLLLIALFDPILLHMVKLLLELMTLKFFTIYQ